MHANFGLKSHLRHVWDSKSVRRKCKIWPPDFGSRRAKNEVSDGKGAIKSGQNKQNRKISNVIFGRFCRNFGNFQNVLRRKDFLVLACFGNYLFQKWAKTATGRGQNMGQKRQILRWAFSGLHQVVSTKGSRKKEVYPLKGNATQNRRYQKSKNRQKQT
jgi:hypothetical protein